MCEAAVPQTTRHHLFTSFNSDKTQSSMLNWERAKRGHSSSSPPTKKKPKQKTYVPHFFSSKRNWLRAFLTYSIHYIYVIRVDRINNGILNVDCKKSIIVYDTLLMKPTLKEELKIKFLMPMTGTGNAWLVCWHTCHYCLWSYGTAIWHGLCCDNQTAWYIFFLLLIAILRHAAIYGTVYIDRHLKKGFLLGVFVVLCLFKAHLK